jgi:hypothetical protein
VPPDALSGCHPLEFQCATTNLNGAATNMNATVSWVTAYPMMDITPEDA